MAKDVRMFFNMGSIRNNLALLVILTVLPAIAILLYSGVEQRRATIERTQKDVLLVTHTMAQIQLDSALSAREVLSTLALMNEVHKRDINALNAIFQNILNRNPNFSNITLVDLQGDVLASGIPHVAVNLADRKHFCDAVATKAFAPGEYIVTRVGKNVPAFPFAYPVLDASGEPAAVLTAAIDLTIFSTMYNNAFLPADSYIAITDYNGIRLFYYPQKESTNPIGQPIKSSTWNIVQQARNPGIIKTTGSDGTERIFAFEPVTSSNSTVPYMYVWAGVPEAFILDPANTILGRNLLFMLLATLGALFIAWGVGRRTLINPINKLIAITNEFAKGNLQSRIEHTNNIDEFEKLTQSFHSMAESLSISQKKLLDSEDRFKKLSNLTFEGILIHNAGIIIDANNSLTRLFGYTIEEMIGSNAIDLLFPSESHHLLYENIAKIAAPPYEVIARNKDGKLFPIEVESRDVKIGDEHMQVAALRDITERQQANIALRESKERYQALHDASFGGVIIHEQGLIIDCNHALTEITGFSHDELIGMEGLKLIAPDSLEVVIHHIKSGYEQGYEVEGVHKDGSVYPLAIRGKNITYRGHNARVIEFRDITDLKKSEHELRESEKHLQLVFDNAPIGLFQEDFSAVKNQIELLKQDGVDNFNIYFTDNPDVVTNFANKIKIIDINRATLQLLNARTKEDLHDGLTKTFTDESYRAFCDELVALAGGANSFHTETTMQTLDGEKKNVLLHLFIDPSKDDWSRTYVSLTDITERKKAEQQRLELERQLRQKYKMEAVGIMAGGMAHNFNNNLSIILGNVELLHMKTPPNSKIDECISNAKIAILRSRDLIKQILSYSRQGSNEKTSIQLSLIIDETVKLLNSTLPATINLHQHISNDSHKLYISADASQIQECLINLCNNAMHAMDETGVLTLMLESVTLQREDIPAQYDAKPGRYAKISVQDTGCGMSAELIDKIFDLFFTTKPVDEGTGVGLSTVQGIVTEHGGLIKVNSIVGHGTTFELYFPICTAEEAPMVSAEQIDMPRGTERVLYVEDDAMLASLGGQILTSMGYSVTTMTDSTAAMELLTTNADDFDIVITDQTMPGITGKELIERLKKIRADIPTILCTGYSSRINEETAAELGISAFLMKPVELAQLLQTVRQVLDNSSSA